jgi:hypothetical protein
MMSRQSRKLLILLVAIELYFLLPLLVCGIAWYNAIRAMHQSEVARATLYTKLANPFFQLSNISYQVARPALWIVRLHGYTDRMMRIAGYLNKTALSGTEAAAKISTAFPIVLKKQKTADDQRTLNSSMSYLRTAMPKLSENLSLLADETNNPQIKQLYDLSRFFEVAVQASDTMGGNKKEGRFLVLFLNDKELRPGGGFIGSYGIITFGHYSLQSIDIHDVYDADGQLREHVDPPAAVRDYLKNPHWFLRDSNMSPDFKENALRAEWFLDKSLGAPPFDGIIAITTTTIEEIIGVYGEITLPDTGQLITKENFYQKTQDAVHENFFPGSRQKQTTLSSLAQTMLLEFDRVPKERLGKTVKDMLDKKEIVAFTKNEPLQKILEQRNWAGRMKPPSVDYVFPVETNVGVNKVNRFVTRSSSLEVKLSKSQMTKHIYKLRLRNDYNGTDSSNNIYKNYFQLYMPNGSMVSSVLYDGQNLAYQVFDHNGYRIPTVYVEVPPQSDRTLTIIYTVPNVVKTGIDTVYNLTFQKQTGVATSDVSVAITLPPGSSLLSKTFIATIRGNIVSYKGALETDSHFAMKFTVP